MWNYDNRWANSVITRLSTHSVGLQPYTQCWTKHFGCCRSMYQAQLYPCNHKSECHNDWLHLQCSLSILTAMGLATGTGCMRNLSMCANKWARVSLCQHVNAHSPLRIDSPLHRDREAHSKVPTTKCTLWTLHFGMTFCFSLWQQFFCWPPKQRAYSSIAYKRHWLCNSILWNVDPFDEATPD